MKPDAHPTCYIIAGPNGAGKTTFALNYLPEREACHNFVNADLIASGLSPLAPEREKFSAARLFLNEIEQYISQRESFAFETTLAGKGYLRLIHRLQQNHWKVILFYLWLPTVEHSIQRVKERVAHGGHDIPIQDIKRRFPRSMTNLLKNYMLLCDETICLNNQSSSPTLIFNYRADQLNVYDTENYNLLMRYVE